MPRAADVVFAPEPPWAAAAWAIAEREAAELVEISACPNPNMSQKLRMAHAFAQKWGNAVERTLHLLLLFGGASQAAEFVWDHGGEAISIDTVIDRKHDQTTLPGLLFSTYCALKLRVKGHLWGSAECKTWLSFLTRYTFKRTAEDMWGPEDRGHIEAQNNCNMVVCWIFYLADLRDAFATNEQPINSLHHAVATTAHTYEVTGARRVITYAAAFGQESLKPLELYTTMPKEVFDEFIVKSHREGRQRLKDMGYADGKGKSLAARKGRWTQGDRKRLQASEQCPPAFAEAIALCTMKAHDKYNNKLAQAPSSSQCPRTFHIFSASEEMLQV